MDPVGNESALHTLNRQSSDEDADRPTIDEVDQQDYVGNGGIRCPVCHWRPRRSDRWICSCGWEWNTFDTRGRCPQCAFQRLKTQCLACEQWSLHEDWYEADDSGRNPE